MFFYKNTNVLFNGVGKNFSGKFEINIEGVSLLLWSLLHSNIKSVHKINDNLSFGIGAGVSFSYFFIVAPDYYALKYEFFSGLTFKRLKSIHSINFSFDKVFVYQYYYRENICYSCMVINGILLE